MKKILEWGWKLSESVIKIRIVTVLDDLFDSTKNSKNINQIHKVFDLIVQQFFQNKARFKTLVPLRYNLTLAGHALYQSMDFISSISFPNEPLISWTFLDHFCHHTILGGFAVALLLHPPKSDDKNGQEMFNWSEIHSEKKYYL